MRFPQSGLFLHTLVLSLFNRFSDPGCMRQYLLYNKPCQNSSCIVAHIVWVSSFRWVHLGWLVSCKPFCNLRQRRCVLGVSYATCFSRIPFGSPFTWVYLLESLFMILHSLPTAYMLKHNFQYTIPLGIASLNY